MDGWQDSVSTLAGVAFSAPVDHIRGPAEVPPVGVGLRATRHPGHRDGLPGDRGCVTVHVPTGPLSGVHGIDPREGNHRCTGQKVRDRPP